MKQVRRVVTGLSAAGKPIVTSDTVVDGSELSLCVPYALGK